MTFVSDYKSMAMKKIGLFVLIALAVLAKSCSYNDDYIEEGTVQLRISNISAFDFKDIYVDTGGNDFYYGDLPSGTSSSYAQFDFAYRYAFIELTIDGEVYTVQPIDYVGEEKLESGLYTYRINALPTGNQYDRLSLELQED